MGDLGKLIVAKGFKKSNKSPNLVTLDQSTCSDNCATALLLKYIMHQLNFDYVISGTVRANCVSKKIFVIHVLHRLIYLPTYLPT